SGFSRLDEVRKLDLAAVLLALLPWPTRQAIDVGLPEHIALPRGRRAAIDYTAAVPLASSRAQDFYGLRETPKLAGGRI
ncbi:ATP-dependent helicase C-terminal domain-containing protein, partial [Shewanella algae]|uniref:ATP-dependent helicase C-terminal domain-containing protein n=1 Tax=Shewanella algae TaxID=38313 RepID=UPI00313EEE28